MYIWTRCYNNKCLDISLAAVRILFWATKMLRSGKYVPDCLPTLLDQKEKSISSPTHTHTLGRPWVRREKCSYQIINRDYVNGSFWVWNYYAQVFVWHINLQSRNVSTHKAIDLSCRNTPEYINIQIYICFKQKCTIGKLE